MKQPIVRFWNLNGTSNLTTPEGTIPTSTHHISLGYFYFFNLASDTKLASPSNNSPDNYHRKKIIESPIPLIYSFFNSMSLQGYPTTSFQLHLQSKTHPKRTCMRIIHKKTISNSKNTKQYTVILTIYPLRHLHSKTTKKPIPQTTKHLTLS